MQDLTRYEAEKIVSNLRYIDGMVWAHAGYLVIAEVRQNRLLRVDADPKPSLIRENSGGGRGVTFDLQSRLYVCEATARRVSRTDLKGKVETFADAWQGKKLNSPNDIVVRRDGNAWFTDPAFGSDLERRELDFHGIFRMSPKGDLDLVAKWQTRPNGVALSPDGRLLYVADSDRHAVVAFDLDKAGQAGNPRDLIKNVAGVPGGIRTDVEGRIYVAARGVAMYSAQGKLERTLLEGLNTSSCTFGDADFGSLFVAARGDVYRVRMGVKGSVQY